ncbi:unnamed protein product [Ilex paraguariensis]|uniref:Phospholipase A-2-activating protein n=1 Tax=Ilex paraguariensis TaxID=185542 RepID=A0ABC8R8K8_9AQUA
MEVDFAEYRLRCQLRGHEDDVRGICVCDNVGIATSSRDRTIRFWSSNPLNNGDYTMSKILLGHTSFVGPLAWVSPNAELPEGGIVSGGMDTLVLVWDLATGEKVQTLKGHQLQVTGIALDGSDIVSSSVDWYDTVRGLAVMPGLGILSASHDGSIRLWALSGEVLMDMVGHSSIVYSVDAHASGLIVSGSEDCLAKIWKDGVCVQSIEHPGCVWDAKFLDSGDIVTVCSDGVVRVWTAHQDKITDPLELESHASQLSQYKHSRKRVGGLKLDELPGLEALQIPGTTDGQTKVVREGDNGVAYVWDLREQKWDKIGEVVDGPDDNMKRPVLDGIQFDYVFDVDIGDGEPIRKLPYNRSDNPYTTADKWLVKENLPLSYRQQIVEFILQNSGQKGFALDSSFRDPFTGSSAYIPGEPSNVSAVAAKPTFKHIPKKGMLVYDVAQFDGILKKISEFNNALLSDPGKKDLLLTEVEISRFGVIAKVLKDTSHYHSSRFSDSDIELLLKLLRLWPVAMMFPVVDILRMIILHPDGATILLKHVNDNDDVLMELIKKVTTSPLPANLLTSIRAVINLFKNSCFYQWLQKHRGEILDAFSSCYLSPNKNVQVSYSTLVLNYAILLIEKKDEEGQSQVLSAALEIAEEQNLDVDSNFRALVAIGSLMLEGLMRRVALDFDVENVAKAAKASKDTKIAEVGADIELIAKQR